MREAYIEEFRTGFKRPTVFVDTNENYYVYIMSTEQGHYLLNIQHLKNQIFILPREQMEQYQEYKGDTRRLISTDTDRAIDGIILETYAELSLTDDLKYAHYIEGYKNFLIKYKYRTSGKLDMAARQYLESTMMY